MSTAVASPPGEHITLQHVNAARDEITQWKRRWAEFGYRQVTNAKCAQARQERDRWDHQLQGLVNDPQYVAIRSQLSDLGTTVELAGLLERVFGTKTPGPALPASLIGLVATVCWALVCIPLIALSARADTVILDGSVAFGLGAAVAALYAWLYWPTGPKMVLAARLEQQRLVRLDRIETTRQRADQAAAEFDWLQRAWDAEQGYRRALDKHQALAELLQSRRYQLIHTDWRSLRGIPFEEFLAEIFRDLGYQVEGTKASGDQGADLIVTGKGQRIAVQVKGYQDSVGNHAVMEVSAGMKFYDCTACAVITNSKFTSSAEQLARSVGCLLIDGGRLPDLILGKIF